LIKIDKVILSTYLYVVQSVLLKYVILCCLTAEIYPALSMNIIWCSSRPIYIKNIYNSLSKSWCNNDDDLILDL